MTKKYLIIIKELRRSIAYKLKLRIVLQKLIHTGYTRLVIAALILGIATVSVLTIVVIHKFGLGRLRSPISGEATHRNNVHASHTSMTHDQYSHRVYYPAGTKITIDPTTWFVVNNTAHAKGTVTVPGQPSKHVFILFALYNGSWQITSIVPN